MTGAMRALPAAVATLVLAACATSPSPPPEFSCLQDRATLSPAPLDIIDEADIAALDDENASLVLMKITVLGAGKNAGRLGKKPGKFWVGFADFASAAGFRIEPLMLAPAGPTAASGWAKFRAYPGTIFTAFHPVYWARALRIDPPVRTQIIYAGEIALCSLNPKSGLGQYYRIEDIVMEPQPVIDELKARYPGVSIVAAAAVRHKGRVVIRTFDD